MKNVITIHSSRQAEGRMCNEYVYLDPTVTKSKGSATALASRNKPEGVGKTVSCSHLFLSGKFRRRIFSELIHHQFCNQKLIDFFLPREGVQIRESINIINLSRNCKAKYRQGETNEY
ncbi:MAG: hypothetical protein EAZ96_03535 [Oscillatoriales cyanobacterium]|nr:MAG: hypothetical protein EAZ96_03535 [Oscillatoriales cyanobacterium]